MADKHFDESFGDRSTLSSQVAELIYRRIRQQRLASGAIIGTEAELAEQFGVSRTVIREAVGSLRGLGIVTSRQGRGLCVARGDVIDAMAKAFAPVVTDERNWSEICHLRFVLEVGSLPLVVERATEAQIERLRQLAAEMVEIVNDHDGDGEGAKLVARAISRREVQFHELIFEIGGSQLTLRLHRLLLEYFYKAYKKGPFKPSHSLERMRQHVELAEAIAMRDVGLAVQILAAHIEPSMLSRVLEDEGVG